MTIEASAQQPLQTPLDLARGAFNAELLGKDYTPGALIPGIIRLQNVLLTSTLDPEKVYHELAVVAAQGIDRANIFEDAQTAQTLASLREGYEITYNTFKPKIEAAAVAKPTQTESLPPMTYGKGVEASPVDSKRNAGSEASQTPVEETFSSFLRQKRSEAKLPQRVIADALGKTTVVMISGLERGLSTSLNWAKNITPAQMESLAQTLNLNEEDNAKLLELYNTQFPDPKS